jgi:hypothetical protein
MKLSIRAFAKLCRSFTIITSNFHSEVSDSIPRSDNLHYFNLTPFTLAPIDFIVQFFVGKMQEKVLLLAVVSVPPVIRRHGIHNYIFILIQGEPVMRFAIRRTLSPSFCAGVLASSSLFLRSFLERRSNARFFLTWFFFTSLIVSEF